MTRSTDQPVSRAAVWRAHTMYRLQNDTHVVFFEHSPLGMHAARQFRRLATGFKFRRIASVIQCREVFIGKVYAIGAPTP